MLAERGGPDPPKAQSRRVNQARDARVWSTFAPTRAARFLYFLGCELDQDSPMRSSGCGSQISLHGGQEGGAQDVQLQHALHVHDPLVSLGAREFASVFNRSHEEK